MNLDFRPSLFFVPLLLAAGARAEPIDPPRGVENDAFAQRARAIPLVPGAPIGAAAWVLMDADSGRVLAGRNADKRMFPASTTKTMTTLLAVESGNMDRLAYIGPNPPKVGEASVHLKFGERMPLSDLVKAALIRSGNDSCVAIAEAVAGTEKAFVQQMNRRARELGARNTRFQNPHGLHHPQHYTTPRDLALIARRGMSLPAFERIVATRETHIKGNEQVGKTRLLLNRNRLLFRWAACDGIKTGYTRQAGYCLVASASRRGADGKKWRLIAVVMKSPRVWSDAYNVLAREGFDTFGPVRLASAGAEFALASASAAAPARVAREVRTALRAGEEARPNVVAERLAVGARKGERAGRVEWRVAGRVVASAPLFLAADATGTAHASSTSGPATILGRDWARDLGDSRRAIGAGLLLVALGVAGAALRVLRARPASTSSASEPRV